jgi:uncharacterized membrane protein (DUF4010 family)
MTGCGCLFVLAAIIALLVIFIRGSFDAGEPVETAVALAAIVLLVVERRQRERSTKVLVGPRSA